MMRAIAALGSKSAEVIMNEPASIAACDVVRPRTKFATCCTAAGSRAGGILEKSSWTMRWVRWYLPNHDPLSSPVLQSTNSSLSFGSLTRSNMLAVQAGECSQV